MGGYLSIFGDGNRISADTYGSLDATNKLIHPHAVTKIMMNDGVTVYGSYTYDANGNQTSGASRTVTWNSWNMPTQITGSGINTPAGTTSSSFSLVYNSAHERVKETLPDGTLVYNISPRVDTGIHVEKRVKPDGTIVYVNSLYAGSYPFGTFTSTTTPATQTTPATTTTKTRYFHTDHLGSIVAITDESGNVTERRSYDAWGKHRNLNGTAMSNAFVTPEERHGFTGHEELDDVGLVDMNGRLYDPATGRFLSADTIVQFPTDLQSYNRYSYMGNNPLWGIDPSGHGWLGHFFKHIFHAVVNIAKDVVAYAAGSYICGPYCGAAAVGGLNGYEQTGSLTGALKGAIIATATAAAFDQVGDLAKAGNWGPVQKALAHGVVGGLSSVAQGGDFRSGFLAAGFADYAGGKLPSKWNDTAQLVGRMVIGGTASVLGGGKFENGAVTAAFGYMFNDKGHPLQQDQSYLADARVAGFLDTIADAEGGYYLAKFGGGIYPYADNSYDSYPFLDNLGPVFRGIENTAAGRYQINLGTWNQFSKVLGVSDFYPGTQDLLAVEILRHDGAIGALLNGNFAKAVNIASQRWASFPQGPGLPGRYNQPFVPYDKLKEKYDGYVRNHEH